MKKPSEKLFKLIRSMSANEKNFFKRQTAAHNRNMDNEYIALFDAIAKQQEYDEAALLKKFKGRAFVKQFAAMKLYLYKVVMQSLIDLYESKDIVSEIHKIRSEARVLIEKGMTTEGLQIYKKAREKAQYWDLPTLQLSLLLEENKLAVNFRDFTDKEIDAFHEEMKRLIDLLSNMAGYMEIYNSFIYWEKRERSLRDQEALDRLELLMQSPLVSSLKENSTFISKLHYFSILDRYATIKGDNEQILQYKSEIFQLYDQHPQMKMVDEKNYFAICINYLNTLYRLKKFRLLEVELKKMAKIEFSSQEIKPLYFSRINSLKLALCEISGDFKDFSQTVKVVSDEYNNPSFELNTVEWRLLFYNIVKLYIIKGDFESAQDWVIKLTNLPKTEQQSDLQRFAELLQILIHYHLGDDFLLDFLNSAVKRKISKKNKLYAYEKLFLDLFHKLVAMPIAKRKPLLKKYLKKCELLFEEEAALNNKQYFDLQLWLEANLLGKNMLELIQQNRIS